MGLLSSSTADLAIDLGGSHVRIGAANRGVIANEPTMVAVRNGPNGTEFAALGALAFEMWGRESPNIKVLHPINAGSVVNFQATEALLRQLIAAAGTSRLFRPRVVVPLAADTSEVHRRAVQDVCRAAGSGVVDLVDLGLVAAIGAGLPVTKPVASLLMDIGAGATHITALSLGGVVTHAAIPVGGDTFDVAISSWLRKRHLLVASPRSVLELKHAIGTAARRPVAKHHEIEGVHARSARPLAVQISTDELADALTPSVSQITALLLKTLSTLPPELAADVHQSGVVLCGGAAQLDALDYLLSDAADLPVLVTEEPEYCAVMGALSLAEDEALYARAVESF